MWILVSFSNRAFCYSQLELHKHVIKDCDKALQLDPTVLQAYILKGLSFPHQFQNFFCRFWLVFISFIIDFDNGVLFGEVIELMFSLTSIRRNSISMQLNLLQLLLFLNACASHFGQTIKLYALTMSTKIFCHLIVYFELRIK